MQPRPDCPRCGGRMQVGYLIDHGDFGARRVPQWVDGLPKKGGWTGLDVGGHALHPVTTYRCAGCGYLESYALPAEPPP